MKIITQLVQKIKNKIARPQPARKGNTPWLGWQPGRAAGAFERAFVRKAEGGRRKAKIKKFSSLPETRSILWTLPGGQTNVLVMAL